MSSICYPCKDHIVVFYKYKEKVRISLENSKKNKIIAEIKKFITQSSEELAVVKKGNVLSLMPEDPSSKDDKRCEAVFPAREAVMSYEDVYAIEEQLLENERFHEASREGNLEPETATTEEKKIPRRTRRYGRHQNRYTRKDPTET